MERVCLKGKGYDEDGGCSCSSNGCCCVIMFMAAPPFGKTESERERERGLW